MTDTLTIALAQLNPTVGDLEGNKALILRARAEAAAQGADLVICTELVVTGYPPEDLVLKPMFQEQTRAVVEALAAATADGGPALLLGAPWVEDEKLYNAVLLLDGGEVAAQRYKYELPNYGGLRRSAGVRTRRLAGADTVSRRPPRRHGLRGHVVPGSRRMPRGIGRRDHDRDQRLALRERQGRRPAQPCRRPYRRDGAAR